MHPVHRFKGPAFKRGHVVQGAMRLFERRGAGIVSYDLSRNANMHRMDAIGEGRIQALMEQPPVNEEIIGLKDQP